MQASSEEKEVLSSERAFWLDWNLDHLLPEFGDDGSLIQFPGAPDDSTFWRIKEKLKLPERIEFDMVRFILDVIDYPYTDVNWPIMSKRMLSTLLSVGDFRHFAYPIVMRDCEVVFDHELKKHIRASHEENHNYVVVHVLEDLDVFDWENSVYELSGGSSSVLNSSKLEKIVLREPSEGFPPLFRVVTPPLRTRLYVSAEAQVALEAAGIRGVDFIQVENNYTLVKSLP